MFLHLPHHWPPPPWYPICQHKQTVFAIISAAGTAAVGGGATVVKKLYEAVDSGEEIWSVCNGNPIESSRLIITCEGIFGIIISSGFVSSVVPLLHFVSSYDDDVAIIILGCFWSTFVKSKLMFLVVTAVVILVVVWELVALLLSGRWVWGSMPRLMSFRLICVFQ